MLLAVLCLCLKSAAPQITSPPEGSNAHFALTAADGTAITEQSLSRGKWLVIYFGYTFCPDVCPTTLMDIAGALDALGSRAGAVQALFVTIDPARDTPSILTEYLKSFDPRIVGLTGTPAQIALAAKNFQVFDERRDTDDGNFIYTITARSSIWSTRDRKFAKTISSEGGSKQIAGALSALMNAGLLTRRPPKIRSECAWTAGRS